MHAEQSTHRNGHGETDDESNHLRCFGLELHELVFERSLCAVANYRKRHLDASYRCVETEIPEELVRF